MSASGAWPVARTSGLPDGLNRLMRDSRGEGCGHVLRLRREWHSGSNRFDDSGEALYTARYGPTRVGICGLNRDPYTADASIARVRHLYVSPDWRRLGVGRALVDCVVRRARAGFRGVRLRTDDSGASAFYGRIGFSLAPDEPGATHAIWFS